MDLLHESERRFTKKLCKAMIPVMIEAFWEIYLEAQKESKGKNTARVFQELLRGVKTWNSSISLKNTEAIIKNEPLFPNLLAAVFVIHVKILSSIRTDKKSRKICIKLPVNDVFVQRCYEACAKDLFEHPQIITEEHSESERSDDLGTRFQRIICDVIEDLVPTAEILQTYLPLPASGEDLSVDHEDEEYTEDAEDADVPDIEPEAEPGALEFGKTPGGVDTTVTTTTSPSVPVVDGLSPPAESLFDDAAESRPTTHIEKLGQ